MKSAPKGSCRICAKPVTGSGEYVPQTCGASECQQADTCHNFHRVHPRRRHACPAGAGCQHKT